jgi:SAM-dependent methyltransferase
MNPTLPLLSSKKQIPGAPRLDFETWDRISPSTARSAAPNFNGLARIYRRMELVTFGPWLARCRFAFLRDLAGYRRAAVLGDGDGRFTAQLLRANPTIEIDAVDSSAAMLRALLRRAGHNAVRVRAHCADARTWQPANPPYDLIVTHFFLDCLTEDEVRSLAEELREALSPSGLWVVSEFAIPERAFGRWVARPLIWLLYRAFGLLTGLAVRKLPDYASALRAAGFNLRQRRSFLRGLLAAETWSAS